jgi:hypothetical protein
MMVLAPFIGLIVADFMMKYEKLGSERTLSEAG